MDYQRIFTILGLFAILASWAFLAVYGNLQVGGEIWISFLALHSLLEGLLSSVYGNDSPS